MSSLIIPAPPHLKAPIQSCMAALQPIASAVEQQIFHPFNTAHFIASQMQNLHNGLHSRRWSLENSLKEMSDAGQHKTIKWKNVRTNLRKEKQSIKILYKYVPLLKVANIFSNELSDIRKNLVTYASAYGVADTDELKYIACLVFLYASLAGTISSRSTIAAIAKQRLMILKLKVGQINPTVEKIVVGL